jgi:hypothetical protein
MTNVPNTIEPAPGDASVPDGQWVPVGQRDTGTIALPPVDRYDESLDGFGHSAGLGGSGSLWMILFIGVLLAGLMMIVWMLRSARQMADTPLVKPPGRRKRGEQVSAWEEAGRRAGMPRDEETPREPGGGGMFDDNDDEDNPDRPMWGDSPRGER